MQLARNLVATRFTSTGTHTGPFQGIAPGTIAGITTVKVELANRVASAASLQLA